jgi:hypothetical protein
MKKAILFVAILLASIISYAHNITPDLYCASTGKVTFDNTIFTIGAGNSAFFYITSDGNEKSTHNTYVWQLTVNLSAYTSKDLNDSVGEITSAGFLLNIPETYTKSPGNSVTVYAVESGTTYTSTVSKLSLLGNGCSLDLPVTLTNFLAQTNQNGSVSVVWTTEVEQNNKDFVLQGSVDGRVWNNIATINSYWANGNSQTSHEYTYTIASIKVSEASMMVGILLLFSLGMLLHFTNRKAGKLLVITSILILAGTSCTKTSVQAPVQTESYKFLRLEQVDIDGAVNTSQVIIL